jgi:UDP-arabinose 4-epimerase
MAAVLVTGGAGFVGAHVCKALARARHLPVTYDDLSRGHAKAVKWGPLEVGDVLDRDRLTAAMRAHGIDRVVHLAGKAIVHESVADPAPYYQINVAGTISVLAAMRVAGVETIVFSSSCSVYARDASGALAETAPVAPASPYARSKVMAERVIADAAAAHGMRAVALRYFNAAGADPERELFEADILQARLIPNLLRSAATGRAFIMTGTDYGTEDGTCVRDFAHVSDIAAAHVGALDLASDFRAINLGSGAGHSVRQMIAAAERVTGKAIGVTTAPRRPGDVAVRVADSALARTALNWRPTWTRIDDIIAHAWASRAWDKD